MFGYVLLVGVLTLQDTHSTNTDGQGSDPNLKEQVKKIEENLAQFRFQYHAQERNDASVLAKVLSEHSVDLEKLKTSHNETLSLYQHTVSELSDLKASHKATLLELSALQESQNQTVFDLTDTRTQIEEIGKHQGGNACLNKDVGFEAQLEKGKDVLATSVIVFDKVMHNEGRGYNRTSGLFTPSVSGTYLVWANFAYDCPRSLAFYIQTGGGYLGRVYGAVHEGFGSASATFLLHLKKGEPIWIRPSQYIKLLSLYSSAGALLINQH